jgi:hypothetical protein
VCELVAGVELGVIDFFLRQHAEEDLEQPLTKTAQGASVAFALLSFFAVVDSAPRTGLPKAIRPEMNGAAKVFIASKSALAPCAGNRFEN